MIKLTEEEKKANRAATNKKHYEANKEELAVKSKEYREANKEKIKAYREANQEKKVAQDKIYREANKKKLAAYREANQEKISAKQKEYREANREKLAAQTKEYYKANKEKINEWRRSSEGREWINAYKKERRKTDPLFRLTTCLRTSVHRYLKGEKSKRTEAILGMTFKDFQLYLEVYYTEGMALDHVVPVSWATTDEEVYALNHFSNFQILTAEENASKGNRFVREANLDRTLEFHNNTELLNKIVGRNLKNII